MGITNFHDFRRKVTRIIEDYAHSDNKQDLVFTPDFTKDERRTIHELVQLKLFYCVYEPFFQKLSNILQIVLPLRINNFFNHKQYANKLENFIFYVS